MLMLAEGKKWEKKASEPCLRAKLQNCKTVGFPLLKTVKCGATGGDSGKCITVPCQKPAANKLSVTPSHSPEMNTFQTKIEPRENYNHKNWNISSVTGRLLIPLTYPDERWREGESLSQVGLDQVARSDMGNLERK